MDGGRDAGQKIRQEPAYSRRAGAGDTACRRDDAARARRLWGEPVDAATPAPHGSAAFGRDRAALVLTAFDQADSAASVAGDVEALRAQEVSPSLDLSIAAVRRAAYNQRPQPSFQHINPASRCRPATRPASSSRPPSG
ncbi:hypothetical protein NKG94_01880 [Micromonospora sp. M12]